MSNTETYENQETVLDYEELDENANAEASDNLTAYCAQQLNPQIQQQDSDQTGVSKLDTSDAQKESNEKDSATTKSEENGPERPLKGIKKIHNKILTDTENIDRNKRSVFIKNLHPKVTEIMLKEHFLTNIGGVNSLTILCDKKTGKSKGHAYMEFESEEKADEAINKLHESMFHERQISVEKKRMNLPKNKYKKRHFKQFKKFPKFYPQQPMMSMNPMGAINPMATMASMNPMASMTPVGAMGYGMPFNFQTHVVNRFRGKFNRGPPNKFHRK